MLTQFLDDIVEKPRQHETWLILADWLEDQNDPRAELVRLTWSLQYEPDHAEFPVRQRRLQTLLANGVKPVRPVKVLDGIEFAWVPPGRSRGSHAGFYVSVYPVLQKDWWRLMQAPDRWNSGSNFPAVNVSWYDMQEYCMVLEDRIDQPIQLLSAGKWEHACRAGTTTPWNFGEYEDAPGKALYGTHRIHEVGRYSPNAFGLYDMHGMVWEVTASGTDYTKIIAGGAYVSPLVSCRARPGNYLIENDRQADTLGFRVMFSC